MREISLILDDLKQRLSPVSDTPVLDAQVLLAHCLERKRAWVLAHPEATLSEAQEEALRAAMERLQAGEPLPYVLGHWEFFGLDFSVTSDVLIPRPETELLVESALEWLQANPQRRRALDVGAGSGCIAVSLAARTPDLHIIASDISWPALLIARQNAARHGLERRIWLVQADLVSALCGPFDLICANLPYIPTQKLHMLWVAAHEPRRALDGGPDGLAAISRLLASIPGCLAPAGLVLLEIEASQGASLLALARQHFPGAQVAVLPDLAGHDRLVSIHMPPLAEKGR